MKLATRKNRFHTVSIIILTLISLVFAPFAFGIASAGQMLGTKNSAPTVENFLAEAQHTGFAYIFNQNNSYFDGKRSVELDTADINKLSTSQEGTLLIRFRTNEQSNQVIFAAGGGIAPNEYGAILANTAPGSNNIRVDFPQGMVANLSDAEIKGSWHTFVYSVDATTTSKFNKTVTSIDGSLVTQYPNFHSWYNKLSNGIKFAQIGNAPGSLAKSSNNSAFKGDISYVAFIPRKLTQKEASQLTQPIDHVFKVFERGDATSSGFFRIPFLLRTTSDTLIAGTDANRGTTGDSADNIDAAIRIKADASDKAIDEGWLKPEVPFALDMQDHANTLGYKSESSSVIDGSIVQDQLDSGRIILHIDLFPWNGGFFEHLNITPNLEAKGGRARNMALGDGFATIHNRKFLLLSSKNTTRSADGKTNNINMNVDRAKFDYVADVYGPLNSNGQINVYKLNGIPNPYSANNTPVSDDNLSLGKLSDYSLDTDFVLYKNGEKLFTHPVEEASKQVPLKVMYKASPLQMYNTSYLLQVVSNDDGRTWHVDQLVSSQVKRENSEYYLLGPGAGIQLQKGPHQGRILTPVYYRLKGESIQKTEIIYSDDGGHTWQHGNPIPSNLSLHESTMVELPNGGVQIFVRNTANYGGKVITATSNDGGITWTDVKSAFGDNLKGINSQISSISLQDKIISPTTGEKLPAFIVTTASSRARVNGVASVGLWHEDGSYADGSKKYRIEWISNYEITGKNTRFGYSSMAQLSSRQIAILYETSPSSSWTMGLQSISYRQISIGELLEH